MASDNSFVESMYWRDQERKYPLVGFDSEIQQMRKEYESLPAGFMCSVIVAENAGKEMVLYVLIWSCLLNYQYVYFVIAPGHMWPPEQEALFHKYVLFDETPLSGDYIYPFSGWKSIYEKYKDRYPNLKLKYDENPLKTIERIYYVTHSCPEKILYEAGFDEVAFHFKNLEDCNLLGNTACELLDDLPETILRSLNSETGTLAMRTHAYRECLKKMYGEYPHIFRDGLTRSQALYFSEIICDTKDGKYNRDDIEALVFFSDMIYEYDYVYFIDYLKKREVVRTFIEFPLIPCFLYYEMYEKMDSVIAYLEHQDEIDREVAKVYETYGKQLEYQGYGYKVVCPRNAQELLIEADRLNNFAWSYYEQVNNGNGIAMFLMREKGCAGAEIIFYIEKSEIMQALGKNNEDPSEEQIQMLENYADIKKLKASFDNL